MNALDQLMEELTPEQRAQVEGTKPRAKRATRQTATSLPDEAWTRANDQDPAEVGKWLGLDDGAGWKCPSCESTSGFDPVRGGFKCLHERCQSRGKDGFLSVVDMVAELHQVEPWEAVNELAAQFGFEPLASGRKNQNDTVSRNPRPADPPVNEWQVGSSAGPSWDPGEPPEGLFDEPEAAPERRIVTVGAAEIFAELPAYNWVSPDLALGPGRPSRTIAKGHTGKSLAWQSALLHIAAGTAIWEHFACRQCRVAHLDYEQGYDATRLRYQRLALGHGIALADLGDRLRLTPKRDLVVYFTDRDAYDILRRDLEGFDFVLVDAQRGAMPDVDENDSKVRRYLDMAGRVSEAIGVAFMFVHHGGKSSPDKSTDARTRAVEALLSTMRVAPSWS